MGKRVNSPLLRYLGWATFVVMTAAAVGIDPYISNSLRTDRPFFWMCGKQRTYAELLADGPVLERKRTAQIRWDSI